jgi:hypothetical protein
LVHPSPPELCPEEAADFEYMLRRILIWRREDRVSAADLMHHPWPNKRYSDMTDEDWLVTYILGGFDGVLGDMAK